jgi:3-oxoacyl-[acyl-carrier-protein] synthase-1
MTTSGAVVVIGVGMTTPVGVSSAETAASVRAGTMRFSASDLLDKQLEPFTLAEVPEDALAGLAPTLEAAPGLTARERRMLRLGGIPLRECLATVAGAEIRPVLCLALPEVETTLPIDRGAFTERLSTQTERAFDASRSEATYTGRAGGLAAIGRGVLTIQSGIADFVIAGGIDSFRDLYVLGTMDMEQRVKSSANLDGFIPGEGAGFVLLASERAAATRGFRPLASLSPAASGFEGGHLYSQQPYTGDGLAATVAQLSRLGAVAEPISEVFSSMNGESHWAKEWGIGYLRNRSFFSPAPRMNHPADCFGDTGAASGPLMVGLAALGISGGYCRGPALVCGSSDRGARAALVVSAPRH